MRKLVAALLLFSAPAFAQNTGPLPQTGLEQPEVVKAAKESGAMDTTKGKDTTGMSKHGMKKQKPGEPRQSGATGR
jgi:hypothetical protein